MTAPTTQSREPTADQITLWVETAYVSGLTQVESISRQAYQAGRAAALAELQAGGVELPEPKSFEDGEDHDGYMTYVHAYTEKSVLDYGDRRAAAANQRIAELEAAILRTYRAKGRYHTEQSAKEMFALVNAA